MATQQEGMFNISNFSGGLNEYVVENMLKSSESVKCSNCNIDSGSLKSIKAPSVIKDFGGKIHSFMPFYNNSVDDYILGIDKELRNSNNAKIYDISGERLDSLNFEYKGKKIFIGVSSKDTPFMIGELGNRKLKNRRISYNDKGEIDGYIDAEGNKKEKEEDITTYAPKGSFIELHYDRLWIAGEEENPDRVYFSTASVNGADIEDFTVPIEEAEANQHGGFIDVRSYDGGKIIGLKVIFNAVVIFKNKTAYKVFGNSPDNYELVELFSSSGAIADKSICVGNNGAYFLNSDGIYYYDGTNTNLVSQKIQKVMKRMNMNYASKSVGFFHNNKYYLAIPVDDSTENNLLIEFNTLAGSFVTHNIGNIGDFIEFKNDLFFSSESAVKSMYGGNTYLPLYWETSNYDYGAKNARKNSSYIYFRGRGTGSVKFRVITEKKEKSLEIPLDIDETLYRKKLKNKGRMFKIIIENVDNSNIEIINPQLLTEIDVD